MDALVTDGDLVGAVTGLRDLARAGRRTMVLAPSRYAAGLLSRHAAARAVGPDPCYEPTAFAARAGELGSSHGPLVVYPSREESIDALLAGPLPPEAILPYAGVEALARVRDKRGLPELAAEAGLRAPATVAAGTARELRGQEQPTPVVVKPVQRGPGLPDVAIADSPESLLIALSAFPDDAELLLQEHAAGPLVCLALVVDRDGRVVERFQHRALRVWPLGAGACATAVGEAPDASLVEGAARMLAAAGYWGLAQFDVLMTPAGPRVIDVNPRFYISMSLAAASGVNLPAAWHDVVLGEGRRGPTAYPAGVSYRRLGSDFSAAVHGHPQLLLARPPRPVAGSVWSAGDPLPGVATAAQRVGRWTLGQARLRPRGPDRTPVTGARALDVAFTRLDDGDAELVAQWRALETKTGAPAFLCWDWLAAWRAAYAPRDLRLVRVTCGGADTPVALGIIERTLLGRWRFAGAPVSPARGLLVDPADARAAWVALAATLRRRARGWSMLTMDGVGPEATTLPRARLHAGPGWVIDLPDDFDAYLRARTASQRKAHKQKLRRLNAASGTVSVVGPGELDAALAAFVELHARRAAAKGEVHDQIDDRLVALLLGLRGSETIALRVLALRVDGALAGVSVRLDRDDLGLACFYNSGIDMTYGRLGPGVTLELLSIRDAIERGHRTFDLGPGFWRYKHDLGGVEHPLYHGAAFSPALRGRVLAAASRGRSAAHHMWRARPTSVGGKTRSS